MIQRFSDYTAPLETACDVLVVGSGPAGGVVAKELAELGQDVILVEEGPPFEPQDFTAEPGLAMTRLMRESGMRATRGNLFMPTMQAIGLGGGTLINSAICVRAPDWTLDKWSNKVDIDFSTLGPHFEAIEKFWGVAPTPDDIQGERNLAFKRGCDALGISCEPIVRNVKNCRGSGECFTGCRNKAKQSMDISYVPAAMKAGARVFTSIRAETLIMSGRKALGMRGRVVKPFTNEEGHTVEIKAKRVVLAAGCLATPLILARSNVGNSSGLVGRELQMHPGLAVMAVFEEAIHPWKGATQGYHSLHYLKEGIKLEVLWAPPAVLATRLPGLGHEFQQHLTNYDHMAPFDVIVAADHSRGYVRPRRKGWEPDIAFNFDQRDVNLIQRGVAILSDIAWAAGAIEVLPGLHSVPERLRSKEEANVLRTVKLQAKDTIAAANHVFGSTRMAKDPKQGVIDEWGRCHDTDNVYVADTGLFPESPAVNPMLTVMALAHKIAHAMV